MTFTIIQDGTQVASALPHSSSDSTSRRIEVTSLAELLVHLNNQPTSQLPMLRTTAGKIAAFLGRSINEISLDLIFANRERFRSFLEAQRYKEGSVRSYVNYLRMLLEAAEGLGWRPFVHLPVEWQRVIDLASKNKCLTVMKFMAQAKGTPAEVTQEDLHNWIELSINEGNFFPTAQHEVFRAWGTLVACGYTKNAPVSFLRKKRYGVPLSDLPVVLKEEVNELLRWKSADFEPERPKRAKVRRVSADALKQSICTLYGYATKIAHLGEISSLEQLMQKRVVARYISWCINEQKLQGGPLVPRLTSLFAAVSKHPNHKTLDVSWSGPLLEAIPTEPYETVKERKAKKFLHYDVVASIPVKIHGKRDAEAARDKEHFARLVMEELLISWLLVFPWRQRNLRECRVGGPNPNLFKSAVSEFSDIDMPEWARKEQSKNPNAEFWQVSFSTKETKTGVAVHTLVPRQLIGLLEEYLSEYRPILLKGKELETLFVSPEGGQMNSARVTDVVSDLTLRYGGRRVTPHLFRDIVAFAWLKAHPKDYLTLSKMLWHKHLSTTINQYGSRFNESSASVAMESWLEERGSGARQK
jgi:integrase